MKHFTVAQKFYTNIIEVVNTAKIDNSAFNDVFKSWKDEIVKLIKNLTNNLVIPVLGFVLILALVIQIGMTAYLHKAGRGDETKGHMVGIIVTIVIMVLVGTATTWAWTLA